MNDWHLPRNKELRLRSTELRNKATKEENHLWFEFLRSYSVQFNRQRIIGNYIVDFYSPKAMLVIEVDCSQHFEEVAIEYDKVRSEYLISLGLKVIRFSNLDIVQNFEAVCSEIDLEVKQRMKGSF